MQLTTANRRKFIVRKRLTGLFLIKMPANRQKSAPLGASCRLAQRKVVFHRMSTVAEIIAAVKGLSEDEKDEFLAKLREVEFEDTWDRQMEADAKAGKLDFLVQEADEAIRKGTLRDWPGGSKP